MCVCVCVCTARTSLAVCSSYADVNLCAPAMCCCECEYSGTHTWPYAMNASDELVQHICMCTCWCALCIQENGTCICKCACQCSLHRYAITAKHNSISRSILFVYYIYFIRIAMQSEWNSYNRVSACVCGLPNGIVSALTGDAFDLGSNVD